MTRLLSAAVAVTTIPGSFLAGAAACVLFLAACFRFGIGPWDLLGAAVAGATLAALTVAARTVMPGPAHARHATRNHSIEGVAR